MSNWITTKTAVELTGYTADYIRGLVRTGLVKGQKWERSWQIDRPSLLAHKRKAEKMGEKRGPKGNA